MPFFCVYLQSNVLVRQCNKQDAKQSVYAPILLAKLIENLTRVIKMRVQLVTNAYRKNKLVLIIVLSFSLFTGQLSAETSSDKITHLFDSYMHKYNQFLKTDSLPSYPQLYTDTVMLMSSNSSPRAISQTQMNEQVQVFLAQLKQDGVSYVKWGKVKIHFLDKNIALVSNIAERYTKSGELYNKVGASYYVYAIDGEWKIAAFAVHDAKNTLL